MALNLDPVCRERKVKTYIGKEMKALGIKSIEELPTEEHRENFRKMIEKNTSAEEEASPVIVKHTQEVSIESPVATNSEGQKENNA